jgi:hypothetical protein
MNDHLWKASNVSKRFPGVIGLDAKKLALEGSR